MYSCVMNWAMKYYRRKCDKVDKIVSIQNYSNRKKSANRSNRNWAGVAGVNFRPHKVPQSCQVTKF